MSGQEKAARAAPGPVGGVNETKVALPNTHYTIESPLGQLLSTALAYARKGWYVLPLHTVKDGVCSCGCSDQNCKTRGKHPRINDWERYASTDPEVIKQWWNQWPDANVGIAAGKSGLIMLDADGLEGEESMRGRHIEPTPIQQTGNGRQWLFQHPGGDVRNFAGREPGLDLRGNGGYFVAPPSNHYKGVTRSWLISPFDANPAPAPDWLLELIERDRREKSSGELPGEVIPEGKRNDTLYRHACRLRNTGMVEFEILAAIEAMNDARCRPPLDEDELKALVGSACRFDPGTIDLVHKPPVERYSGNGHDAVSALADFGVKVVQADNKILDCLYRNEAGDADLFAHLNAGKVVYDHSEGRWYLWDGNHWQRDVCNYVVNLVSGELAGTYLVEAGRQRKLGEDERSDDLTKRAAALRYRNRINNVLKLAASHPDLALTGTEWSTDPWLLGCANGVLDLKTGDFRPGKPEDYIRTYCPTEWHGLDAPAERWEQFLDEIFDQGASKEADTAELVAFVKRLLGYSLTGLGTEHVLPIAWGPNGRNGKDTLFTTMLHILGHDLAEPVSINVLTEKTRDGEAPSPMLYGLRFKRLVWASEPSEGVWLNSAKVKLMTGGAPIRARGLHKEPVTFDPQYLAFVLCNPRPHAPADDKALWERVLLIPFIQSFIDEPKEKNEHKADKNLGIKLQAEAPGILASLVLACLDWQANGLKPPQLVKLATKKYRSEEDDLGRFLEESTVEVEANSPNADLVKIKAGQLYAAYKAWCDQTGVKKVMTMTEFGKQMSERGYEKTDRRKTGYIYYLRIGLATDQDSIDT